MATKKWILCVLTAGITNLIAGKTLEHQTTEFNEQIFPTTTDITDYNYIFDLPFDVANVSAYNCVDNTCIVKCCPEGQLYHIPEPDDPESDMIPKCVEIGLYNTAGWKPPQLEQNNNNVVVIYGLPPMILGEDTENFTCSNYESNEFYLKEDGWLYFYSQGESFSQESYCVDKMNLNGKIQISSVICHKVEEKSQYVIVTDKLHVAAITVSCLFLFLILILFAHTPHFLDLQKKCTLCCCVNLFLGFLVLLINNTPIVTRLTNATCLTLGLLTQFFFLSFYFWLNVTCFEISRIIRGTFHLQSLSDLTHSSKRFLFYCGYTWGSTFVICSITVTMQLLPLSSFPQHVRPYIIKPEINEGRCWLEDGASEYAYYYVIEIFLHVTNAIFMGYTAYLLYSEKIMFFCCREQQATQLRNHAATNYLAAFKQQLKIYIMYLFIWIMNTITLINRRAYVWKIVDIIVALQGLFLFLFIIQTNKTVLVTPLLERLSNTVKGVSDRIGELTSSHSSSTEITGIYSKSQNSVNLID